MTMNDHGWLEIVTYIANFSWSHLIHSTNYFSVNKKNILTNLRENGIFCSVVKKKILCNRLKQKKITIVESIFTTAK